MGILDSVMGAVSGNSGDSNQNSMASALGGLFNQNGGLQGLMAKFHEGGLGGVFSSWVGTGVNQAVSAEQIQKVLGSEQVAGLASKLGVDPQQASAMLAQHLPGIVDKLTPGGQVDPNADHAAGLGGLLQQLGGKFGLG